VGDFLDVIEFTFNISYDTANLTFIDLLNINPDILPGDITTSPLTDPPGLKIHWEYGNPVSISSGKLFDIEFSYNSGNHIVAFESGSEVLNSSFNLINITLTDGHINQLPIPLITAQPQNDTVKEDHDALFSVEAVGASEYIWQLSTDSGNTWTYLSDAIPYYNTHTASLTISPAIYGMNGYLYSCRLDNESCTIYSAAAILIVDTLTSINAFSNNGILLIHPVPFRDKLNVSLPGDYHCHMASIYDTRGILLYSFNINEKTTESQKLELDLSALAEGFYILKFQGVRDGREAVEIRKILKTD
jgi:hypothetical protein